MTKKAFTLGTLLLLFTLISGCPWWPDAEPGESLGEDPMDALPALSGCTQNENESNNEFHLANPHILSGCGTAGNIEGALPLGDIDTFNLGPVSAGDRIRVRFPVVTGGLDPVVAVFNQNQELMYVNDNMYSGPGGNRPFVDFISRQDSGLLFLVVTDSPSSPSSGDYTVTFGWGEALMKACSEQTSSGQFIDSPQFLNGVSVPPGYYFTVEALMDSTSQQGYGFAAFTPVLALPYVSSEPSSYPPGAIVIPPIGNDSPNCVYTVSAVMNSAGDCETILSTCNGELPFQVPGDYSVNSDDCDGSYRNLYINKDAIHPFTIVINDLWSLVNRVPTWGLHNTDADPFYVSKIDTDTELRLNERLPKDYCAAIWKPNYGSYDAGLHIPGRPWLALTNEFGDGFSNIGEIACTHSHDHDFPPLIDQTNDKGVAVKGGDFVLIGGHSDPVDMGAVPEFAPVGQLSRQVYTTVSISPHPVSAPLQVIRFPIVDSPQSADGLAMTFDDGHLLYSNSVDLSNSNCNDVLDGGLFCPAQGPCRAPYGFEIDICDGNPSGRMQLVQNTNPEQLDIQKVTAYLSTMQNEGLDNAPFQYCLAVYSPEVGGTSQPVPQNLLLDFDGGTYASYSFGPFDAGGINSAFSGRTDEMVDYIFAAVQRDYEPFNVNVYFKTPTRGEVPPEPYSTVYIANVFEPCCLGTSHWTDPYNVMSHSDNAIVFANEFDSLMKERPNTSQMAQAIANVASHEAGHLMGLYDVVDSDAIMHSGGYPDTRDRQFKTSPLHPDVFETGLQNSRLLLELAVGAR